MKMQKHRTSGFEKEHLRLMKNASVESKFHALTEMIKFAQEAQRSCQKRGARYVAL